MKIRGYHLEKKVYAKPEMVYAKPETYDKICRCPHKRLMLKKHCIDNYKDKGSEIESKHDHKNRPRNPFVTID